MSLNSETVRRARYPRSRVKWKKALPYQSPELKSKLKFLREQLLEAYRCGDDELYTQCVVQLRRIVGPGPKQQRNGRGCNIFRTISGRK